MSQVFQVREIIMNIGAGLGVLLVGVALTGCAGLSSEYGHRDGWRPGTVTRIGNDPEILEQRSNTCPRTAESKAYALIRYTGNSHLRWLAFPVTEGMDIKAGDKVNLDINACKFTKAD